MDRRTIWAILLMMVIAIVPAIFLKKPVAQGGAAGPRGGGADTALVSNPSPLSTSPSSAASDSTVATDSLRPGAPLPRVPAGDKIVRVVSPLYTYGISSRGGRLVEATLSRYRSMNPADLGK